MSAILEGKGVTKSFGGVKAVVDVDFSLQTGELLGLIGPNGAGKTTLLNCISGVFPLTSGEVLFNGKKISGRKPYEIARMGIGRTYQVVRPFVGMTVAENVRMGAMFGRERNDLNMAYVNEVTDNAMEFVGLTNYRDKYSTELTISMRKRLELGRAYAMEPSVLLLDEVMAGLNASEIEELMQVAQKINKSGVSIIMIEHVMKAVMGISDRIMVLQWGNKIAEGTPNEIVNDEQVVEAYLGRRYMDKMRQKS